MATLLGTKQVYPGRYDPEKILRLIQTEKVTFSHCVPTILHMLLNHPYAKSVDFRGWKVIIGGVAFPKGLAKKALEMGIDAYAAYGMSETCPVLTVSNLKPYMMEWDIERQLHVRIKTDLPMPLTQLRIIDETGLPVPRDGKTPGEIVVRTPWLTQGYLKETKRSEELWRDGWLHTGDVAVMDQEGYVRITDRLKDVIKTGGEWVSSLEVENLFSQHEAVSEAAVVGIPHEKWGERPFAMVVLRPEYEGKITAGGLRDFLEKFSKEGVISKWAVPDEIKIVKEIPKTSVGKINKRQVRSQLIGGLPEA